MNSNKQGIRRYQPDSSGRLGGLAVVFLLHAGAVVALLEHQPVRSAITEAVPFMVSLIAPPESLPQPSQPKPAPIKRKAEPRLPAVPALVASATDMPTPDAVSAAPVASAFVTPSAPATTASVVPSSPLPVTQPSYNADYLQNPVPRYPPLARRMGQQGKVVLRVLVNAGGEAAQVELRTSSGSELLDAAALDAVRRWRFVPARQGEQVVSAWVLVPITFTLQG